MTATPDDVTSKKKTEPAAEAKAAQELVRRAREQGPVADPGRRLLVLAPVGQRWEPGAGLLSQESVTTHHR